MKNGGGGWADKYMKIYMGVCLHSCLSVCLFAFVCVCFPQEDSLLRDGAGGALGMDLSEARGCALHH